MKIDKRHRYFIVIDTETCGGFGCPLTYDIGYCVIDGNGSIYEKRSFVIDDIFFGEADLMKSAYYAKKIPLYHEAIAKAETLREFFNNVHRQLAQDIEDYSVIGIIAHNANFDVRALNSTKNWLFGDNNFFDFGVAVLDSLRMAKAVFGEMPTYEKFCRKNCLLTRTGRMSYTAENIYRYIIKDTDFDEAHMAVSDAEIETQIFVKCRKRKGTEWCFSGKNIVA